MHLEIFDVQRPCFLLFKVKISKPKTFTLILVFQHLFVLKLNAHTKQIDKTNEQVIKTCDVTDVAY